MRTSKYEPVNKALSLAAALALVATAIGCDTYEADPYELDEYEGYEAQAVVVDEPELNTVDPVITPTPGARPQQQQQLQPTELSELDLIQMQAAIDVAKRHRNVTAAEANLPVGAQQQQLRQQQGAMIPRNAAAAQQQQRGALTPQETLTLIRAANRLQQQPQQQTQQQPRQLAQATGGRYGMTPRQAPMSSRTQQARAGNDQLAPGWYGPARSPEQLEEDGLNTQTIGDIAFDPGEQIAANPYLIGGGTFALGLPPLRGQRLGGDPDVNRGNLSYVQVPSPVSPNSSPVIPRGQVRPIQPNDGATIPGINDPVNAPNFAAEGSRGITNPRGFVQ